MDIIEPHKLIAYEDLEDRKPHHGLVLGTDLVIIRSGGEVSVLYGRCLHRGALMADGYVQGDNLICGLHSWDYRFRTGVSAYNPQERLHKFRHVIEEGQVVVDLSEFRDFEKNHTPARFDREAYLGVYQDTAPEKDTEPHNAFIRQLARDGLKKTGHHGPVASMGVPRSELPTWDDIQILPAQLWRRPLGDDHPVNTTTTIGPAAKKPLVLGLPLFVSDMSFGAISREAKVALALGSKMAGTGICSGEGGMLKGEKENSDLYLYELASGRFGFDMELVRDVQAFHFKGGQGAKTGVGGHLPAKKVTEEIARVRGLKAGEAAISPPCFEDLITPEDFREVAQEVRRISGGIPVGFKIAASHIEKDLDFALEVGVDYIILDGRGGGTGAAPTVLRDHINVPTLVALPRARKHLDACKAHNVSLVITGGLRIGPDFVKALALGADAVAVSNAALQAVGCLGMRACHTGNCPVGIATQKPELTRRLEIEKSSLQLFNYLQATCELMKVLARACGYGDLKGFCPEDLATFKRDMHHLTGVSFMGNVATR